jgi:hypothetical protein
MGCRVELRRVREPDLDDVVPLETIGQVRGLGDGVVPPKAVVGGRRVASAAATAISPPSRPTKSGVPTVKLRPIAPQPAFNRPVD